jgi:glycosyltransferase involved in cell wall biosynthesis
MNKVAFVLFDEIKYSEKFFRLKLDILRLNGFNVTLFKNSIFKNNYFQTLFVIIYYLIIVLIRKPKRIFSLYNLNSKSDYSRKKNLFSLMSSLPILSSNYDVIYFGFLDVALGMENLGLVMNCKLYASARGSDIGIKPILKPNCYNLLWKRLNKLHYLSDDILNLLIYHGLNTNTLYLKKIFPGLNCSIDSRNREFNNDKFIFLSVSRLNWKKGLDYVIDALVLLSAKNYNFEYHIVGDGPEFEKLKFVVWKNNLVNKVIFHGVLPEDDVYELMKKCDYFIQYSLQEGFCNSVIEAQCMGCISIVSDAEGLNENIIEGQTGFIVKARNSFFLYKELDKVVNLTEIEKLSISNAAKRHSRNKFNLENHTAAWLDFYKL